MHLINKEDDLTVTGLDFLHHGLEPFFKLAAIFRARHQRAHIQHQQRLVEQGLGDITVNDTLRQTLGNGGLAHTGLADQHRVVLGPA